MLVTVLWCILSSLIGFIVGVLYVQRQSTPKRTQQISTLLEDVQTRHDNYQKEVRGHFEHTAELVNELTQRYRELHQHLQAGAEALCSNPKLGVNDNPARQFMPITGPVAEPVMPDPYAQAAEGDFSYYDPPRDYATKQPTDKGMLDERYGLR